MNKEEQLDLTNDLQGYLSQHSIPHTLHSLLHSLLISQPSNPIEFMINQLMLPQSEKIFVVGPPGVKVGEAVKEWAQSEGKGGQGGWEVLDCGKLIEGMKSSLSEQSKEKFSKCKKISDEEVKSKLFPVILKHLQSSKNVIIQGYPRTLRQAIWLQQNKIPLTHLLILNTTPHSLMAACLLKIQSVQNHTKGNQHGHEQGNASQNQKIAAEIEAQAKEMALEHLINIKQIKEWYGKYREIDVNHGWGKEEVFKQLQRAFSPLTLSPYPRSSTHLLIIGSPLSGRTTLGLRLAARYSLVYVSSSALLADEIRKDSVVGRKIKTKFEGKEMIEGAVISKLVDERIQCKDCRMQGCVIEGYPKTPEQWESMSSMSAVRPTMIIALSCSEAISTERISGKTNESSSTNLSERIRRWKQLQDYLSKSDEKVMWVNTERKPIESVYEEVVFQLEKGAW